MGRKCNVLDCPSDSRRIEDNGVTFHKMPFHPDLRPKWLELCRVPDDRKTCKIIYVCSRHFRRTDFCNFKGTKYMLRQGALPSVFPWTKIVTKVVQPATIETQSDATEVEIKTEPIDPDDLPGKDELEDDIFDIKKEIKSEPADESVATMAINFLPGTRIEANDFNEKWYPASIVEVDYEENEVLVEFDKHLNRANEWIPMDSSRLRPFQARANVEYYSVGERVLATWTESCNKFPAVVRCILEGDSYEVLFDDGFTKVLKHHKMAKLKDSTIKPIVHIAPLFDPVVGSKEERRERKRKINVAELFGVSKKKVKHEEPPKAESVADVETEKLSQEECPVTQYEGEEWTCRWMNGEPVGIESTIESNEGIKRSIIVADHRLPPGWEKHFTQRITGNNIGKWDAVLVNSNGKRFHSKNSIKNWLEDSKSEYHIDQFDFCLHLNRARKLGLYELPTKTPSGKIRAKGGALKTRSIPTPKATLTLTPKLEPEEPDEGGLKIIMENDSYKCPIDGCDKNFRKENLAQMHVKHYHPEYSKLMGSTPNVADLAYARTVGEPIDDHTPKSKHPAPLKLESTPKPPRASNTLKVITPKIPIKSDDTDIMRTPETTPRPPGKDSEIIKLLNSEPKLKTLDAIFDQQDLVSSKHLTPQDKHPEIKLKDLLRKSETIPKRDEYRPSGIKTLLPVIRTPIVDEFPEEIDVEAKPKPGRKRQGSENEYGKRRRHSIKYDALDEDYYDSGSVTAAADNEESFNTDNVEPIAPSTVVTTQESPQVIIEGGEVIRLVHMRSEEIINCTCGITEEDGLMIQCELCLCWQHAHCNNIQRENQVPDKYVCKICKNPLRMRASKKYIHDQDWLKQGALAAANYHTHDEQQLSDRFEKLRKTHELSGCLLELNEYVHNLRIKLNIAENKDHPKLYLWAKPWDKTLPEGALNLIKQEIKTEDVSYPRGSSTFGDVALKSMLQPPDIKIEEQKLDDSKIESQSELISILEDNDDTAKIDLNQMMIKEEQVNNNGDDNKENVLNSVTTGILSAGSLELALSQSDLERLSTLAQLSVAMAPQPEAPIDSADCRTNLLDHVAYYQNLVEERLNYIESEINDLEEAEPDIAAPDDQTENYPKTKQTLQMLIRDLSTMRQIATLTH